MKIKFLFTIFLLILSLGSVVASATDINPPSIEIDASNNCMLENNSYFFVEAYVDGQHFSLSFQCAFSDFTEVKTKTSIKCRVDSEGCPGGNVKITCSDGRHARASFGCNLSEDLSEDLSEE